MHGPGRDLRNADLAATFTRRPHAWGGLVNLDL
jgi:hypothetical protein